MNPPLHPRGQPFGGLLLRFALGALLTTAWLIAAKPDKAEVRELKREMGADPLGGKPRKPDAKSDPAGGRANPSEAESRALSRLREYMEITDDAEWELIATRIIKVGEIRKTLWTGAAAGHGGPSFGEKDKRGTRPGTSAHPEQDALRSALKDKLPDAEIKARLARAHELYQENQARLARAQEELRAILSVRQEAVAVMAGLLPP